MVKRVLILLAGVAVLLALWYVYGYGSVTPKGQPPLTNLGIDNFATLQKAFNESPHSVRVIVMLSPT